LGAAPENESPRALIAPRHRARSARGCDCR
jgi:hypothetical protein